MNDYLQSLAREVFDLWVEEGDEGVSLETVMKKYAGWLPPHHYGEIWSRVEDIAKEEAFIDAFGYRPQRDAEGRILSPTGLDGPDLDRIFPDESAETTLKADGLWNDAMDRRNW